MDTGLSCGIISSDDCAIHRWSATLISVVDIRCVDIFQNVHPEVILNFGLYNSVISVVIFWFGWCSANTRNWPWDKITQATFPPVVHSP